MLWKDKIEEWKSGNYFVYPHNIKNRFFYETYVCDKNMNNIYEDKLIENNNLDNIKQDYSSFIKHITKSINKYVTSFNNLSGDTILIIPIPKKNKDFTTIKDFCDNASITHQKAFWKKVANEIENILKNNDKIYISTHGFGVYYFHLRLDTYPKYYHTKEFKNSDDI
jgi:hypothetical protein